MLEHFRDWEQTELTLYFSDSGYNPVTGRADKSYKKREDILAWVFQSSSMQGMVSDKIIDQSDYVGIYEGPVEASDIAEMNGVFYEIIGPDNVLFQDCVYTFGLRRTEKPEITAGGLPLFDILGDRFGAIGDDKGVLGDRES